MTVSGVYKDKPGEVENCFVVHLKNHYKSIYKPDYFSPEDVQGEAVALQPGEIFDFERDMNNDSYLPEALSPKVEVNILGVTFTYQFPVKLINPEEGG